MNIEQEIRAQIEKNKGLKLAVGEINNHLSILEGLLRNDRDDAQKQVNEAYQKGLDDAWEAAKKIVCDEELDWNTLLHIFNRGNFDGIFGDFSASEAIEKLKAYEEKQKAENEINVGDEVDWSGDKFIVTRIFQPYDKAEECDGVDMDGCTYHDVLISGLTKTGRHVDITDILKGALE